MKYGRSDIRWPIAVLLALSLAVLGCGPDKEAADGGAVKDKNSAAAQAVAQPAGTAVPSAATSDANPVIEVDGEKMTKRDLEDAVARGMVAIRAQAPLEQLAEAETELRKNIVEQYITRTVFAKEAERRNVQVPDGEVEKAFEHLKEELPKGVTFEQAMKLDGTNPEKLKKEIATRLRIRKMILEGSDTRSTKPTAKEIEEYYRSNPSQFQMPERVRARHILVAVEPSDDEKGKAAKAAKAKDLREQLLRGADFSDLAKRHSDCPSKGAGGDLGEFARGQMIKPFEDAAFSQKKNEIGPVIETSFGYHIIQVSERHSAGMADLSRDLKDKISSFLESLSQRKAVEKLGRDLRAKAKIVYFEKGLER